MSVINTGKTFANGEQLTADKLNQVIDQATFNASEAVDGSTITLISGAMAVNDSGITEAKIGNGAVTTNKIADGNVTKAKIENVTDMTVLGNTSGSDAAPQEVAVLDEDDMTSNSATALATQQSIKAYVDGATNFTPSTYAGEESVTLPNGLIMKWGKKNCAGDGNTSVSFGTGFPTACVNVQCTHNFGISVQSDAGVAAVGVGQNAFNIRNGSGTSGDIFWQAIGY
jgi:hypothetical protein